MTVQPRPRSASSSSSSPHPSRRALLGAAAGAAALPLLRSVPGAESAGRRAGRKESSPVLVGSANARRGMEEVWASFVAGGDPLDAAIGTVKVVEADEKDSSVGLGGLPNEAGVVQLDAACMHGPTHNSGAVACIENILHPSEVARLVMERTDHCLLVGRGAYEFARMHGHEHVELLTEASRKVWLEWKETMSDSDDRFPPRPAPADEKHGSLPDDDAPAVAMDSVRVPARWDRHGTIHCSALSVRGELACTTTTSGLAFKVPGRVGDSPIIGAGLYCDQEAGSAGSTGRGEAAILSNGSFAIVELLRQKMDPLDAGLEVLRRIARQVQRQAKWQPALLGENGQPSFGVNFYILSPDGRYAGVTMKGHGRMYAAADVEHGPRHLELTPLFD